MSSPSTAPSSSPYAMGGLCDITGNIPELAGSIFQTKNAGRKREMQTYMVGGFSRCTWWQALTFLL